jgi:ABC-type amino acid transport substrate-binding protein
MRILYAALWLASAAASPLYAQDSAAASGVTLAFRTEAAPFSSLGSEGLYEGFIADLCEEAVARTDFPVAARRGFTAAERSAILGDETVDLVCDPMTLTRARATRFDFSPIVFIANSGFLQRPDPVELSDDDIAASEDCRARRESAPDRALVGVGMVRSTTANATYDLAREQQRLGNASGYDVCTMEFSTHVEGVKALCDGKISYYFGDLDIILHERDAHPDCRAELASDFLAYEPYALPIPSRDADFRHQFVASLYELFADGTAIGAYRHAFGTDRMSQPLAILFRINNVPRGQTP